MLLWIPLYISTQLSQNKKKGPVLIWTSAVFGEANKANCMNSDHHLPWSLCMTPAISRGVLAASLEEAIIAG